MMMAKAITPFSLDNMAKVVRMEQMASLNGVLLMIYKLLIIQFRAQNL